MSFFNDESDRNRIPERAATQGDHVQRTQLEIAQRIARETLAADHQALELDARLAFRVIGGSRI